MSEKNAAVGHLPEFWGLASGAHRVALFDKDSLLTHSFAGELYERRKGEIDHFAAKAGFRVSRKSRHMVSFIRKDGLTVPFLIP